MIIFLGLGLLSCNWAKDKAKGAVNKTGEVVAKTGSEFAQGLSNGVDKSFSNEVVVSGALKAAGLRTGKITYHGTDSTTDNIVTAYLIFDKDLDQHITIKVLNAEGVEYGRTTQPVKGGKGEANYWDFVFDRRTNIDGKGKLVVE